MRLAVTMLGMLLALAFASCITPTPEPEATVRILVRPTETGLSAGYSLPSPTARFSFRDSAADIRTDTWNTQTPGAMIAESAITFSAPTTAFQIAVSPDTKQRDRIYPALTPIGAGWLIYAPHLLPAETDSLVHQVEFDLPRGWVVIGRRDGKGKLVLDGWVYAGPESQVERGAADVVTAPDTPAWLRAEVLKAANDSAALYRQRLGVELTSKPGIIIAHFPKERDGGMRGDVTPGAMVSVRFYGSPWSNQAPGDAEQVREFLAHETFHFWNGDMVDSAENAERPWLHEGGASYAALLALEATPAPDSASLLKGINENLGKCQSALGENESMMTADMRGGDTPYACGVVLQWAWDAGLRSASANKRDVLSLWQDVIAEALRSNREYSVASTVRLVPAAAGKAADVLLNDSGAGRWNAFADALRGYGAAVAPGRVVDEDRATALMHVLGQHCTGQRGFYTRNTHLQLDTGNRCGPLNGDKEVDAVAGHNVISDVSAMYDRVREICAAGGVVEFTRNKTIVASAPCTRPLKAPMMYLRVTRAFGG